jgi:N-acetylglucosamine-6-phosphate deacetylase
MTSLIKNCRIVSSDLDINGASIEIKGNRIGKIYFEGESLPKCENVFDADGRMAMPGFIDIHNHGAMGYDAADDDPKAVRTIAETKIKEGVTTYIPTTLTLPTEMLEKNMRHVAEYQKSPSGAKVPGVHLEGPYINCNCAGAQNPAYVRKPDIEEVLKLNDIARVLIVSYAIEVEGGMEFTRDLLSSGIVPSCGHTAATHADFKKAMLMGLKHLTHFCNQMTPLHHREIGLVGSGFLDDNVLVEVICDKIHLCPDMLKLVFSKKPIDKIAIITDAMRASWLPDGEYDLGGLAVCVRDKAARLKSNDALAGSTLRFNEGLRNVYEVSGLPLSQAVKAAGYNQARSLGLEKTGKIEPGFFADIAVLDDEFVPQAVFVNGEKKL